MIHLVFSFGVVLTVELQTSLSIYSLTGQEKISNLNFWNEELGFQVRTWKFYKIMRVCVLFRNLQSYKRFI